MRMVPLKLLCKIISGAGFPHDAQGQSDNEIPFYKVGSLSSADNHGMLDGAENSISYEMAKGLGAVIVPPNSCLMAKIGAATLLQRVGMTMNPACFDNNMMAIVPKTGVHPRYLFYILQTISLQPLMNPGTVPNLNMEFFRSVPVPFHNYKEQQKIALQLDRELAEIDELIADQKKLLNLITEKYNAELFRLCLPQGFPYVPLKRFADVTLGKMKSPTDKGGMALAPYIRAANIQPGGRFTFQTDSKKMWFTSDEINHLNLCKDDVLVVEGGAGFGRSAILSEDLPGWGFQNSINRVRVNTEIADPNFINFTLQALLLSGRLELEINQSTIQHLTAEKLSSIPVVEILLDDQIEVTKKLYNSLNNFIFLKSNIDTLISILSELKNCRLLETINGGN